MSVKSTFNAMTVTTFTSLLMLAGSGIATASTDTTATDAQSMIALTKTTPIELTHVHGLAYSADGKQLLIPSHHGIAAFSDGRWAKMAGPEHDFMGFTTTREALYSSGHPAAGSNLINPFGLIKSTDSGKTWWQLGLEGESDFHIMAASYETNAVYVLNYAPNSQMSEAGLYMTQTDGLAWARVAANGLNLQGKINSVAVHPSNASVVAVGTPDGLYLSRDAGKRFEPLVRSPQVLAQWFDLDDEHIWVSSYENTPSLSRIGLNNEETNENIKLPKLNEDAVAFIAQNPARHEELAIATFKRSAYITQDSGTTWTQIADSGTTRDK